MFLKFTMPAKCQRFCLKNRKFNLLSQFAKGANDNIGLDYQLIVMVKSRAQRAFLR